MKREQTNHAVKKPLLKVLHGEKQWPPPVWFMRQAGRFLPEFRAVREKADFLTRCTTTDIVTELTLQPIRRFQLDAAILFSDILILPWALGQDVQFVPGHGPKLAPCRSEDDLASLKSLDKEKIFAPIERAIEEIAKQLKNTSTTFLGFAGSPFTVVCYMVEGGGSKNFEHVKQAAYKNPQFFKKLIDFITHETVYWLERQIKAGVESIMLFDSWASILPPRLFKEYVIDPTRFITDYIKRNYPHIKIIGFPRLCGTLIQPYGEQAGIDVVSCDTTVDLSVVDKLLPSDMGIQGNLDPFSVVFGGKVMEEGAYNICKQARKRPHIFNLGHGVLPQTPVENVARLVKFIRSL